MMISSYCINNVVNFLQMEISSALWDKPNHDSWLNWAVWFTVFFALIFFYSFICFQQNYQNYKYLSWFIYCGLIYAMIMCLGVALFAIYVFDWQTDPNYKLANKQIRDDIERFTIPPFCIIPALTISFCFQFYFL